MIAIQNITKIYVQQYRGQTAVVRRRADHRRARRATSAAHKSLDIPRAAARGEKLFGCTTAASGRALRGESVVG